MLHYINCFNKCICITTVICIVVLSQTQIHFDINSVAIQMHNFESEYVPAWLEHIITSHYVLMELDSLGLSKFN